MQIEQVSRDDMNKYGPDIGKIRALQKEIMALRKEVVRLKRACGEPLTLEDIAPR